MVAAFDVADRVIDQSIAYVRVRCGKLIELGGDGLGDVGITCPLGTEDEEGYDLLTAVESGKGTRLLVSVGDLTQIGQPDFPSTGQHDARAGQLLDRTCAGKCADRLLLTVDLA